MTSNTDKTSAKILIALGANIASPMGPPAVTLKNALVRLEAAGVGILRLSPFYETNAWPDRRDPPFVNAVAELSTALQPIALLTLLHQVETEFGRKRSVPNAPRTLDLDLIDYRGQVMTGALVLPHPAAAARRFVLEPLRDVAPDWRHPVTGLGADEMLAALSG